MQKRLRRQWRRARRRIKKLHKQARKWAIAIILLDRAVEVLCRWLS